jgi:putative nucleotidyltransferase with HDIG domain
MPDADTACPRCGKRGMSARGSAAPCICATHDEALEGLVSRAVALDPEGRDHPVRVGRIAALLAEAIGVDAQQQALLQRAAVLHDIGKMALPEGVPPARARPGGAARDGTPHPARRQHAGPCPRALDATGGDDRAQPP